MATETVLHERIKIDGAEEGTAKLGRLAGAAERLSKAFGGIMAFASASAGIAGVMKFAEAVGDADKLLKTVSRISAVTKVTAENTHALQSVFESGGVELESYERIMMSMARLAGKLGGSVAVTGEQAADMVKRMRRLGVDVKAGPVDQLVQLSKAAQRGRLALHDLSAVFGIQSTQARELLVVLQKGPQHIREGMTKALGSSALITDATIKSYKQMTQARRDLSAAWGDLVLILYKSVIPSVTLVLETIKDKFEAIEPVVTRIGTFLRENMETVVGLAGTYVKLMAANKVVNLFGKEGEEKSVIERVKGLFELANSAMSMRANKAGAMDYFAARSANPAAGMFANVGGPLTRIFGSVFGRLGVIGAVVGIVAGAFMLLKNNTLGLRDAFAGAFKMIATTVGGIVTRVVAIFEKLFAAIKPLLAVLGGILLVALLAVTGAIDIFAKMLSGILDGIIWLINAVIDLINYLPGVNIDTIDIGKAKANAAANATEKKTPGENETVYQDFRGSKFEITNNFPQNVDGGRVAVAFGDQLARLGERRIDSGLRPLFGYR